MSWAAVIMLTAAGLLASAFFSGAEMAILSADRAALLSRAKQSNNPALAERFLDRPQWFLATTLVGAVLGMALAVVPLTYKFIGMAGAYGALYAFLVLTPVLLLFGRIIPKIYFMPRASRSAPRFLFALRIFSWLLFPVLVLVLGAIGILEAVLGKERGNGGFWYTRDEIKLLLSSALSPSDVDEESRHMIERIFEFSETLAEEVMVPLVEVEAIDESSTVEEALFRVSKNMYSRYPVFSERIDNITGTMETFDLLDAENMNAPVSELSTEVRYVPYNKPIDELLYSMQRDCYDFAVVVDEYGGCVGVITREDIVEEVVGEIEDEHDHPVVLYRRLDKKSVIVNARMEIDDINEHLGWDLPEGDYETLGGFLLSLFRRVPGPGERIRYNDMVFSVKDSNTRSIQELVVEEQIEAGPID